MAMENVLRANTSRIAAAEKLRSRVVRLRAKIAFDAEFDTPGVEDVVTQMLVNLASIRDLLASALAELRAVEVRGLDSRLGAAGRAMGDLSQYLDDPSGYAQTSNVSYASDAASLTNVVSHMPELSKTALNAVRSANSVALELVRRTNR